jgi:DNA polymerase I-like protein with 3'-5' exonuclease and polymerase domains
MLQRDISETYESTLAAAINADQDCHVRMAATMRDQGESYEDCYALYKLADGKKEHKQPLSTAERDIIDARQLSKALNFGLPGGLGPAKFIDYAAGYGATIDLATARQAKRAYEKAWIEMRLYFWHIGQMCKDDVAVVTQLYSKRQRGDCFFTQAANSFFQGLAADGAKEALRRIIRAAYRDGGSALFGTRPSGFVHDEFLVNCKIEQAPRALPALEHEMVQGMMQWIPDVKIKAPGKILYDRWGK